MSLYKSPESSSVEVARSGVPVHFLHIRKTGGTALAEALRSIAPRYGIILHDHQTKLRDIPRDHKVFFFVRNPITRFVSGFYSRLRRGQPRHHYEWNDGETRAFRTFQKANDLAEALSSHDPRRFAAAQDAMSSIRHVNSTYRDWIEGVAELSARIDSVLLIGSQETITEDFARLKALLDLPGDIKLPSDDVLAHRTPPEFDRQLSTLAAENLAQWYKEDFVFYEHCIRLARARELSSPPVR